MIDFDWTGDLFDMLYLLLTMFASIGVCLCVRGEQDEHDGNDWAH